jgi:hypothetical protein
MGSARSNSSEVQDVYDGIKQFGQGWPIPVDNSFLVSVAYAERRLLRQEAASSSVH